MMLGGNIRGVTRNITTAIAFETGKGEFSLGIALGIILLVIAFSINILSQCFQRKELPLRKNGRTGT
jgi:tungstate transport system permease protein